MVTRTARSSGGGKMGKAIKIINWQHVMVEVASPQSQACNRKIEILKPTIKQQLQKQ